MQHHFDVMLGQRAAFETKVIISWPYMEGGRDSTEQAANTVA